MYTESAIETVLRDRLDGYGFKVLKLRTPGTAGVMDRMILFPLYSPRPPMFVELKAKKNQLRPLQAAIAHDWERRGCTVLKPVLSMEDCHRLCDSLLGMVMEDFNKV